MKRITSLIVTGFITASITACDDNDSNSTSAAVANAPAEAAVENSYLRVIHGAADAPLVNVLADGSAILENVDFEQGSAFLELPEGNYPVTVDAILPDMSTTQVLDLGDVALEADYEYTVVAHGMVTDSTLATAVVANMKTALDEGNIRLQVLHAAPNAPMVDLHVTTPEANIDVGAPLASISYGDFTPQVDVAAGTYRVRLALAGTDTIAYDVTLPALDAGTDLFVTAVPNTGVTTSPVVLLANTGQTTLKFIDDRTESWVRVAHSAADVPNVDILANGAKVDSLSNAPFTATTDFTPIAADTYTINTVLTADNNVVGISSDLTLEADTQYTVHAVGTLDSMDDAALEYYVLIDDVRAIATEAQLRLTHAHPSVGNVDIYITADGNITDATPAFSDIPYKASTGYFAAMAGDYVVQITPTGAKSPIAIDTGVLTLEAGMIYSATAINNPSTGNLMLMDDF